MSVNLSPISARNYTVGAADDPYKKYWLTILVGFVFTGVWLLMPMMETSVGSNHVDGAARPAGADAASGEQSLDSVSNPSGAPGAAVNLGVDGKPLASKSGGEDMTSMLYQGAPPEAGAAAAGAPLGDATAASPATLAQQLKDAGAKADASGWSEKAQRGFGAPHLAGAGLSGTGSAHGGSSASSGLGTNFFGSKNAQVNLGVGGGLLDDGSSSAGFKALKASAGAAAAPNLRGSNEALQSGMSRAFDGSKGKGPAAIGAGMGAMAQASAALNSAPANLKTTANPASIDTKNLPTPPSAPTPQAAKQALAQQMMMTLATAAVGAAVGGLVTGLMGQMMASAGMSVAQQELQARAAANATAQQAAVQKP